MPRLEVFYDYACPFCYRGHKLLMELLPDYPGITVDWRPCEANPRPNNGDLCIQGLFFARDAGADLAAYNDRMYELRHKLRADVGDPDVLVGHVSDLLDAEAFRDALRSGKYLQALREANDNAYEQNKVWALPAYRMDGQRLDAALGMGVTRVKLQAFLDAAKA